MKCIRTFSTALLLGLSDLHEQAKRDRDKLAHIEEVAASRNFPDSKQGEESDD